MTALGCFGRLPEPCLYQILHFVNVRDVFRCQRLSSAFDAWIRANISRIHPVKIKDTWVNVEMPEGYNGLLNLWPAKNQQKVATAFRFKAKNVLEKRIEPFCTRTGKRNRKFVLGGTSNFDLIPRVHRVLEYLAKHFEFQELHFVSNIAGFQGDATIAAQYLPLFQSIQRVKLLNAAIEPTLQTEMILKFPQLSELTVEYGGFRLDEPLLDSSIFLSLTRLFILFDNDSSLLFDDDVLLEMHNLTNLELRVTNPLAPAPTSVTYDGIRGVLEEFQHGERAIVRYSLFVEGDRQVDAALPPGYEPDESEFRDFGFLVASLAEPNEWMQVIFDHFNGVHCKVVLSCCTNADESEEEEDGKEKTEGGVEDETTTDEEDDCDELMDSDEDW